MQPTTPPSNPAELRFGLSEVPTSDLRGFSQMTTIMSFVANKPLHTGGAFLIK